MQAVRASTADVQRIASHRHTGRTVRYTIRIGLKETTAEGELLLEGVGIQGNDPGTFVSILVNRCKKYVVRKRQLRGLVLKVLKDELDSSGAAIRRERDDPRRSIWAAACTQIYAVFSCCDPLHQVVG